MPRFGVAAAAVVWLLSLAAPAVAQEEIPDVVGLPIDEAQAVLAELDIASDLVDPPPPDLADAEIVVIGQENFPEDRFVRLAAGTVVPDLVGTTGDQLPSDLASLGLELAVDGERQADWLVVGQSPPAGTLVGFGETVVASLEPARPGPHEPEEPLERALLWLVVALAALLLIGASALVRRRYRRVQTRPPTARMTFGPTRVSVEDAGDESRSTSVRVTSGLGEPDIEVREDTDA